MAGKILKSICTAAGLLILASGAQAQEEEVLEQLLLQQEEDEGTLEALAEQWLVPAAEGIALNRATVAQLRQIPGITEPEVQALLAHREKYGPFLSIFELQAVEGLEPDAWQKLAPWIRVDEAGIWYDPRPWKDKLQDKGQRMLQVRTTYRLEKRKGLLPDESGQRPYRGDGMAALIRFRWRQPNGFSFGFTADKDVGERWWDKGTDFYSGHVMVENRGRLVRAIAGDYQLGAGLGLMLGSGMPGGKGADPVLAVAPSERGLLPHTSTLETGFFRGAAATVKLPQWEITGFGSYQQINARLEAAEDGPWLVARSLPQGGYHRTDSEHATRNTLPAAAGGATATWRATSGNLELGGAILHSDVGYRLEPTPRAYNLPDFRGEALTGSSVFARAYVDNFYLFGEVGKSMPGGFGGLGGFLASVTRSLSLTALYRHYAPDFYTLYGQTFGEASEPQNEQGLYLGLKYQHGRRITVTAYADWFRFPAVRFRIYAPGAGNEYLTRFSYRFSRRWEAFIQYLYEEKPRNLPEEENEAPVYLTANTRRQLVQMALNYKPDDQWRWQTRAGYSRFSEADNTFGGFALVQDLTFEQGPLRLTGRVALFDTEAWDARFYFYEPDVLYTFTIPALSGQGVRSVLLAKYKLSRELTGWLRYARFSYFDREAVGSGQEEVEGNRTTDLRLQVVYNF